MAEAARPRRRLAATGPEPTGSEGSDYVVRFIRTFLLSIAGVLGAIVLVIGYGVVTGPGRAPPVASDPAMMPIEARSVQSQPPTAVATEMIAEPPGLPPVEAPGVQAQPQVAAPESAMPAPTEAVESPAPEPPAPASASPPAAPTVPATLGPASIREAQRNLTRLGFDPGKPDGVVGTGTRAAVRAYQKSRGMPETGELTVELAARLAAEAR